MLDATQRTGFGTGWVEVFGDRIFIVCHYRHIAKRASRAGHECQDLASLAADNLVQALAPEIERGAFLEIVAMPVVDRRDARLNVVEDLLDHEPRHAASDHETGPGAPQVVAPELNA